MKIVNNTSFKATWLSGKGPGQGDYIVVVIKGTFDLIHNQICQIASEQLPIFITEQHRGDPRTSSVKVEGDFVTYKPKTDIILLGKACTPIGSPIESCDVSLSMNGFNSTIRVIGDRNWIESGGTLIPSAITKFITMDLIFENAFGGVDPDDTERYFDKNPIGKGYYSDYEHAKNRPLPNLEDPSNLITRWNDEPDPICFGWYGKSWQPRLEKAGDVEHSAPNLPSDFDWKFNNGAAPDLIRPYLAGDETFVLQNCDSTGNFMFILPGITPEVKVDFEIGSESVNMVLDTVCIITESEIEGESDNLLSIEKQVYLVWRGRQPIDATHRLDDLHQILIN